MSRYAVALVGFLLVTCVWFAPLVADLGGRVLWGPGDATNSIRYYWMAASVGSNPFQLHQDMLNGAPEGLPTPPAVNIAAPVQPAVVWALQGLIGVTAAFNVYLLAGFVLTAVAAFILLDRLRLHPLAAVFGAYVIAFNPWMFYKARDGHAGFTQGWALILAVGAGIWLVRTRSVRAAAALGGALGLCFWIASYWGLLASLIVGVTLVVELVTAPRADKLWSVTLTSVVIGVAALFLVPGAVAYLGEREAVNRSLDNPLHELQSCAAGAGSYLLPADGHPVCGGLASKVIAAPSLNELTLFFGYSTMLLAAGAVLARRRRRDSLTQVQNAAVTSWAVLAPVALYFSLPRLIDVGPFSVPGASYFVGHLTNFYRCYVRFGYVFGIALALLAAVGVHMLVRRYRRAGTFIGVAAITIVAFELIWGGWMQTWDADRVPAHDRWLARQPPGIVAHYPMQTDTGEGGTVAHHELYFQRFHGHPLYAIFGAGYGGSREEAIRILTRYPDDRAAAILAAEGVRYVLVHDDRYRLQGSTPPQLGDGYRLVTRIGSVRAFRVAAEPVSIDEELADRAAEVGDVQGLRDGSVTFGPGFHPPEEGKRGQSRWLVQNGRAVLHVPESGPSRFVLVGTAFSGAGRRTLAVEIENAGRYTADLATNEGVIRFGPLELEPGDHEVTFRASPGPARLSVNDARIASVYLGPMQLEALADYSVSIRRS